MIIKEYLDFDDLLNRCWSGAVSTLETIYNHGMQDEFMSWLESYFDGMEPSLTEVNDLLWFESDYIFSELGIMEDDEDE